MNRFMFYGFILLIVFGCHVTKAEDCTDTQQKNEVQEEQVITTDVPNHLKDAKVCIFYPSGPNLGYHCVPAEKFKVVPRKQQRLVTKVKEHTERICKVSGKEKNLLMFGGRRDHKNLDTRVNGKTATVESEKGLVLDASYLRQNIFDSKLGVGAGVDSNGTLRGIIGVEF